MAFTGIRTWVRNLTLLHWLLLASTIVLVASFAVWWQVVYTSPQRVFNAMLKNNFATSGFTRQVNSVENGFKANELSQLQTGGQNITQSRTTIVQNEDTVETSSIGTTTQEFVRYDRIETEQKSPDGKTFDFADALGIWAKNDTGMPGQTFSQMLLGIVPIGNVSADTRGKLMDFIDKHTVFSPDYKNVKTKTIDGRKAYVYKVKVLPQSYAEMLKMYGEGVGFGEQVAQIDPAAYADMEPINIELSVDVLSRNILHLSYTNSERTETYSGHGIRQDVKLPQKTIPYAELQQKLSAQ